MGRLKNLDDRILGSPQVREALGRKHAWSLDLVLGLVLLTVCAWAVAADLVVIAVMNVGLGAALVAVGVFLFVKRDR